MDTCQITKLDETDVISLSVPSPIINKLDKKQVVIIFDKSTSIDNDIKFSELRLALIHFICRLLYSCKITLVVHAGDRFMHINEEKDDDIDDDDRYDIETYHDIDKSIISKILKIKSVGNTNMIQVFNTLESLTEKIEKDKEVSYIFFTDGIDTAGNLYKDIEYSINRFLLKLKTTNYKIHCVSPKEECNMELFTYLVSKSVSQGSSTCLTNLIQLYHKLDNLAISITPELYNLWVIDKDGTEQLLSNSDVTNFNSDNLSGTFFLLNKINEPIAIKVKYNNTCEIKSYPLILNTPNSIKEQMTIFSKWFEYNYIKYVNYIINNRNKTSYYKDFEEFLIKTKDKLSIYLKNILDEKSSSIFSSIIQIYEQLFKYNNILEKYKNYLENSIDINDFSELINGIYITIYGIRLKNILPRHNNNKLVKHMDKITEISSLNCSTEELKEFDRIIKPELENIYPDTHIFELLKNKDCICMGINITKNNGEKLDQLSNLDCIEIVPIKTSIKMFYLLKKCMDEKQMDKIYNLNGKKINMVIPLYLFDEHWEIASQWTELLYKLEFIELTKREIFALPFLAMGKMLVTYDKNKTNENKIVFDMLFKTCCKITAISSKDNFYSMITNITGKFDKYLTREVGRIRPAIDNNLLFVLFVYILIKMKKITALNKDTSIQFVQTMAEEEARRTQMYHTGKEIDSTIFTKLVNLNPDDWISKTLLNNIHEKDTTYTKDSPYKLLIKWLINSTSISDLYMTELNDSTNLNNSSESITLNKFRNWFNTKLPNNVIDIINQYSKRQWTGKIYNKSVISQMFIDKTIENYNNHASGVIELIKYCTDSSVDNDKWSTDLVDIGLDTYEKQLTFSLQNYIVHDDNMSMRSLISKDHINPFNQHLCEKFLREYGLKCIKDFRNENLETILSNFIPDDIDERIEIFANTDNEMEAAGALYGALIGKDIIEFAKPLQEKKYPLAIEKIKMLLSGKYKDIILVADYKHEGWIPGKSNCHKLWKINKDLLPKWEWANDIFSHITGKVWSWYRSNNNNYYNMSYNNTINNYLNNSIA